jgi:hypothetical protein
MVKHIDFSGNSKCIDCESFEDITFSTPFLSGSEKYHIEVVDF